MSYTAPVKDMQFVLHDVLNVTASDIPGYADLDAGFTAAVLDEAGALISQETVSGPRYSPSMQASIDTEDFA